MVLPIFPTVISLNKKQEGVGVENNLVMAVVVGGMPANDVQGRERDSHQDIVLVVQGKVHLVVTEPRNL